MYSDLIEQEEQSRQVQVKVTKRQRHDNEIRRQFGRVAGSGGSSVYAKGFDRRKPALAPQLEAANKILERRKEGIDEVPGKVPVGGVLVRRPERCNAFQKLPHEAPQYRPYECYEPQTRRVVIKSDTEPLPVPNRSHRTIVQSRQTVFRTIVKQQAVMHPHQEQAEDNVVTETIDFGRPQTRGLHWLIFLFFFLCTVYVFL
eukprot:TRINITY_DN10937_c0_g1_i1.p1 TRINITY_DN10937_c0_g1~~TRINITY_DN10937_c0_g1_i1.p1  ORF type:complete len:219 (+),score=7.65 TRINITY_DN10937_c0_g1_i1:57-659(+)